MPRAAKPNPQPAPMIDDEAPIADTLTGKQRAFVNAYIANDFHITKAAIEAGYSEASAYSIGSENLKKPEIKAAIDAYFEDNSMEAREVTLRLTAIARGDLGKIYNEETGQIDWKVAREKGLTYLIKKVDTRTTRTTSINAKGEEVDVEVIEDRYELHDPLKALTLIGKQHGLFVDKSEVNHTGAIILKTGMDMDDL